MKAQRMRCKWVQSLCLAALWGSSAEAVEFDYQENRLGAADIHGAASVWVKDLAWVVPVGSTYLPLRFQFCSRQEYTAASSFGAGWWCPLLESTAQELSESHIRIVTLGGEELIFAKDRKEDGKWGTLDGLCKGEVQGTSFRCDAPGGWKLHYKHGLLQDVVSPEGDKATWVRKDGKVVSITSSSDNAPVLSCEYTAKGMVKRIASREFAIDCGYGDFPIFASGPGGLAGIQRIEPSLNCLTPTEGDVRHLDLEYLGEDGYTMSVSGVDHPATRRKLSWNNTGYLTSELVDYVSATLSREAWSYQLLDKSPADQKHISDTSYRPISRHSTTLGQQLYFYDRESGIEYRAGGGTVQRKYFIAQPGQSFMKIRKVELGSGFGGPWKTLENYSLDQSGQLLRETIDDVAISYKTGNFNPSPWPVTTYDNLNRPKIVQLPMSNKIKTYTYPSPP